VGIPPDAAKSTLPGVEKYSMCSGSFILRRDLLGRLRKSYQSRIYLYTGICHR
jgi:hypothetical protein